MTTVSRPTKTGWWRLLLAAIAAALVGLLGAGTASAATLPNLETRVGASPATAAYIVGVHESVSAGQRRVHAPPDALIASATGVAANTARVVGGGGDHIVLGLSKGPLIDEAAAVGGRHLMGPGVNWQAEVMAGARNPGTKFTVVLDGMKGNSVAEMVANLPLS